MKLLKYFFSFVFLKMDRFLLNSESENKEDTPSNSGKRVKKRKYRKYDDSYLDFGLRRQKSMVKRGCSVYCV